VYVKRPCVTSDVLQADELAVCQWKKLSLPEFASDLCVSQLVNNLENFANLLADELAVLYDKEMSELFEKQCPVIRRRRKCGLLTPWFEAVSIQPQAIKNAGEKIPANSGRLRSASVDTAGQGHASGL